MAWTLCSSGAAINKAGINANSDIINDDSIIGPWSDEAEGWINAETRRDWLANPPNAATSGALTAVSSSYVANMITNSDMGGYALGIAEASLRMDVHADLIRKGIAFLKDEAVKENM